MSTKHFHLRSAADLRADNKHSVVLLVSFQLDCIRGGASLSVATLFLISLIVRSVVFTLCCYRLKAKFSQTDGESWRANARALADAATNRI